MTGQCATYVLQWKFFDKPALHSHSSPLDVIDSITAPHHKAKVMYYYEVKKTDECDCNFKIYYIPLTTAW